MTNKTMPERIHAGYKGYGERSWDTTENPTGNSVEYIRADLVTGDANEPLANGQNRWAVKSGIGWFVIVIHELPGGFFWYPSGNDYTIYDVNELSEIGPVIHPPKGKE